MVLKMDDKVKMSSVLNASEESAPYIEALYESFIQDPNSVSQDWKIYFETLPKNPDDKKEVSHKDIIKKFKNQRRKMKMRCFCCGAAAMSNTVFAAAFVCTAVFAVVATLAGAEATATAPAAEASVLA